MKKRLTELLIQKLAPPTVGRLDIFDELSPGLVLRVTQKGKKTWSMLYRVAGAGLDGKTGSLKRYTLGAYPFMDLKSARAAHRKAKQLVDLGIDPSSSRQDEAVLRNKNRYNEVLERYVELYARPNTKNWRNTARLLECPLKYGWHQRDIREIGRSDVHELIDLLIKDRGESYASELRRKLSKFFNWAVDRGMLPASPMAGMRRPELAYIPRERVLEIDEIKKIWLAADQGGFPFGPIVKLLILTGQRRSEIAGMRRSWLSKEQTLFEIPATIYKTKRVHVVPLSTAAATLVSAQPFWEKGEFLFSTNGGIKPVSGFSKLKLRLDKVSGVEDWTLHDIRRSVATHMARLAVAQEHIERVLGHVVEGVAGTYNRYSYFDEKLIALEKWQNELKSNGVF